MEREAVVTDFDIRKRATKRLIIFGCVICLFIGLGLLAIISVKLKDIKAKMTEVTNSMSNVASAVTAYNQDLNSWPHCDGVIAIRTSLGLIIPTNKISSITINSPTAEEVIITATIKGIDPKVDGKNLTLTGKPSERGILWVWGGNCAFPLCPKEIEGNGVQQSVRNQGNR